MWKTQLNKAVKELRFVLKDGPANYGAWKWVNNKLPSIQKMNQNTFFSVNDIGEDWETESRCHFVYGDKSSTYDHIDVKNLSEKEFEKILIEKVKFGLTLERFPVLNDDEREIPIDIVEAGKYVKFKDDQC